MKTPSNKPKRKPLKMSKPLLKTADTRTAKPVANPKRIKNFLTAATTFRLTGS
jgi:hypothetical protein